jgi:predicted dehydrogenase
MQKKVQIAMVGLGYWGPNILRNFVQIPHVHMKYICDLNEEKLQKYQDLYPESQCGTNYEDLLADSDIEAVIVVTSSESHFTLASEALKAGKHVFVEKPLTLDLEEAKDLVALAKEKNLKLMVGHLLMYHPAVTFMKNYIESEEFGDLRYIYTTRVNLGKVRHTENALWSLAPHDLSVILHLTGEAPLTVEAQGESYLREGVEDVVFTSMSFSGKVMAHIHVSWLDPHKVRKMTVVGSKKMLVFDDMEPIEKIKIYDKAAIPQTQFETYDEEYFTLSNGDIYIPELSKKEPLRLECEHFIDSIITDQTPLSDGQNGCDVLSVLMEAQRSLKIATSVF